MLLPSRTLFLRSLPLLAVALLAGCSIAKPRTDDPYEKFNRKAYAFNNTLDKAIIRPVAMGYRKVTTPPMRSAVDNFFDTIHLPITIANDLLQGRPGGAFESTGRLLVNLTVGVGGLFDPATRLGMPLKDTDFGITLARWGVPDGPFLMIPFMGPSTVRDVWHMPVDGYFFDPVSYLSRNHHFTDGLYYVPDVVYFISLRSQLVDAESFLNSAYDPYAFMRDAYRQHRVNMIYDGNPPLEVLDQMQGNDQNFDPDKLLQEQQQYEDSKKPADAPAKSSDQPSDQPVQN